jgi:pilus assembly protein CpaB
MKPRTIAYGVAMVATTSLAYMYGSSAPPKVEMKAAPSLPQVQVAPPEKTVEVLIATRDMEPGTKISPGDLSWTSWPERIKPQNAISRREHPEALRELEGVMARNQIIRSETVTAERFILDRKNSYMSAVLKPGMRAVAVSVSGNGTDTAGGFVLPGDFVDIIRIDPAVQGRPQPAAQMFMRNVKILAVGQTLKEQAGQKTLSGTTATIEVTPSQAEAIAVAQRSAALTMTLRPFAKDDGKGPQSAVAQQQEESEGRLTIVRSGVAMETSR